jgi:hypothetical protein
LADASPERGWNFGETFDKPGGDDIGSLSLQPLDAEASRAAFVDDEHMVSIAREAHEIGLPMAWDLPVAGLERALGEAEPVLDEAGGSSAAHAQAATAALLAWRVCSTHRDNTPEGVALVP